HRVPPARDDRGAAVRVARRGPLPPARGRHGGRARQLLRRAPAARRSRRASVGLAAAVALRRRDGAHSPQPGRARCAPSTRLTSCWPSTTTSARSPWTASPATAASSTGATSPPARSGARRRSRRGRRACQRGSSPPCSIRSRPACRLTSRAWSSRSSSSVTPAGAPSLLSEIPFDTEALILRMMGVLVIEVFAIEAFRWAREVLGDRTLFRRHDEARTLIEYIQEDETPHVGYLATALAELRRRRLAGVDGAPVPGRVVIDRARDRIVEVQAGPRHRANVDFRRQVIERCVEGHPRRGEVLGQFDEALLL